MLALPKYLGWNNFFLCVCVSLILYCPFQPQLTCWDRIMSLFGALSPQPWFCYRLDDTVVLLLVACLIFQESLLLGYIAGINSFHTTPNREWFETDAVLRVSLGNFLFFTILAILMIGVKNQKDPRDSMHHGGWMMKIICWCLMVIFMFFLPNGIISFYGKMSYFS